MVTTMPNHSVYALCEPNSTKVRYVGRTSSGLMYRLAQHVMEAGFNPDSKRPVLQWVRRLAEDQRMPAIILLAECDESEAPAKEQEFINKYSEGYKLLNKSGNGQDWAIRKTITLPEAMADFVIGEAERRGVPAYQFVFDAVEFYARAFPVKETAHDD